MSAHPPPPKGFDFKAHESRYRIVQKGERFYPQFRHYFWGWRTIWHFENENLPEINRIQIYCLSIEGAQKVCDNHAANRKRKNPETIITKYVPK